ncbi:MAG TPA: phosphoribosyltransferase family protein [Burkholderiaceae bacterium]|nr:phosphoribosyltransferase family protein [Burkholderiaceae bacterium]
MQRSVAALDYGFPWDGLVAGLKFHGQIELAPTLARLLSEAVVSAGIEPAARLIVPVPLSQLRLRKRGYNQAWELARRIARWHGASADPHLLQRIRDTAHQLELPEADRAANVRDAFLVEPRHAQRVRGRDVALVDDVMTTGATTSEAARALLAAGATQVEVWVLARTPTPGG